jgi:hypothetical protein
VNQKVGAGRRICSSMELSGFWWHWFENCIWGDDEQSERAHPLSAFSQCTLPAHMFQVKLHSAHVILSCSAISHPSQSGKLWL